MAIFPSSLYAIDPETGVNLTLESATAAITRSFNALSTDGIAVHDLKSVGGGIAPLATSFLHNILEWSMEMGFHLML